MPTPYLLITANCHQNKTIQTSQSELTNAEAWGLAQLFKRLGWSEIRACAVDDAEAYEIRDAVAKVQRLLADAGINPR